MSDLPDIVSQFIGSSERTSDVPPLWLQIVSWIIIAYGVVEFISFTAIFTLVPVKLVFLGNVKHRIPSLFLIILFIYIRVMYIPIVYALLPIEYTLKMPYFLKEQSFYIVFITYTFFGVLPVICTFLVFFHQKGWRRKTKMEGYAPKISVIMPIYNEDINDLLAAVYSIINSKFEGQISLYCTFDSEEISILYLALLKEFKVPLCQDMPRSLVFQVNNGNEMIVTRSVHGGKRIAQKSAWEIIRERNVGADDMLNDHHILLVDSDIVLDKFAMHNMASMMSRDARRKAITGYISCFSKHWWDPLQHYQNAEYMQGQMVVRVMESSLGGVTCLPGALTMVRYGAFRRVGKIYFSDLKQDTAMDYHRFHLGEDRYLTHLLMQNYDSFANGMCIHAHASTRAVGDLKSLLKQRRRWLLGAVANEAWMIISIDLWQRIPFLLLWKVLEYCSRFIAVTVVIFALSYGSGYQSGFKVLLFFSLPFIAQWIILIFYSIRYRFWSMIVVFPLMCLVNSFVYTLIYIYGIYTFNTRSWGGPRISAETNEDMLQVHNSQALMDEMMSRDSLQELKGLIDESSGSSDTK